MERNLFESQQAPEPWSGRDDNLWNPVDHDGGLRGRYRGHTMRSSMYTSATLHPVRAAIVLGAFGAAVYGLTQLAGMKPRAMHGGRLHAQSGEL